MVTRQQQQSELANRRVKSWKLGVGCSILALCVIFACYGLYMYAIDEDFSRCFLKYPPWGAENRFNKTVEDIDTVSQQNTLLAEPKPSGMENLCGCGYGQQIRAYGTNQSYDEVLEMFKQAMVARNWQFKYSSSSNILFRRDQYGDSANISELTITRTDPNVSNLWLFWDASRYYSATATIDLSKPWNQFKTQYLVVLNYGEPNMNTCFSG